MLGKEVGLPRLLLFGAMAPPGARKWRRSVAPAERPWTDLLAAAVGGDPAATQVLYRGLAGRVHAYVRAQRVLDPEDVTSEVFLRVFRNLARFEGDSDGFRAWVFTIAHRTVVDARRQASRRPVVIDLRDGVELAGGDVESDAQLPLGAELRAALAALTGDQRDVLFLRVVAELSLEQTARAIGKPLGAVKALQHRALSALRRNLVEPVSPG
jgi:RNA polymerase sigma factor (sigma-70 family)